MSVSSVAENIREYLLEQNKNPGEPVVFKKIIAHWPASQWTPENLPRIFGDEMLNFRIGKRDHSKVQWEGDCVYEQATVGHFTEWTTNNCSADNPLSPYPNDTYWCYADYKYMSELFKTQPDILKEVDWSTFGFPDRDGHQSTFWLGSSGAYTVCHYDTYGCNLVAEIYGRKRWVLFPPSQTEFLYPTRIPYEESSVFSQVCIQSPDLSRQSLFQKVSPYVVILEPGDVLFVPRHWWHFVECLETSIAVNSWIELPEDNEERIREAVVRTVAIGLMSEDLTTDLMEWLNPTEDATDHSQNLAYVEITLEAHNRAKIATDEASSTTQCSTSCSNKISPCHVSPVECSPAPVEQCSNDDSPPLPDVGNLYSVTRVPRSSFDKLSQTFLCLSVPVGDRCACSSSAGCSGKCKANLPAAAAAEAANKSLSTADVVNAILHPSVLDAIVERLHKTFQAK